MIHSRHGSAGLLRSRVPEQKVQDTPRNLSGTDGQADSLEAVGEEGGSLLSQGPERSTTVPVVFHAAGSLHATLLRPVILIVAEHHDLFSEKSRQVWGVSRAYLTTAGFGAGAIGGVGIDAVTLGTSLGAGALIGGIIGAAGSYFYGDRLALSALKVGPLRGGLQTATFGPVQDSQFGYIILGRAIDHWWHISHRNHAGRASLTSHRLKATGCTTLIVTAAIPSRSALTNAAKTRSWTRNPGMNSRWQSGLPWMLTTNGG
jgi:hypothetical protein